MESITTASYSVHFGSEAFEALRSHLNGKSYSKVYVLVDENTGRDCLPLLYRHVPITESFLSMTIPSGEQSKNIATCEKVWQFLSDHDADRHSLLINLGGGVLTDLGGFVASTFKRGIAFINVPTTLLAMVDASVGGKTGVDLGSLKNQIGVINQPEMVLVHPDFLKTLEWRQLLSGYAEMLKHGLIQSTDYWERIKAVDGFEDIDDLIRESVSIKNEVVVQDPMERNLRKILNFGHTLGHAIESHFLEREDKETLLHGEAIAIGMVMEAFLSHRLTGLPQAQLEDIRTTFGKHYGHIDFSESDILHILELLKFDKKNAFGQIRFVLLHQIGEPAIDVQIPVPLLREAFAYYSAD